MLTHGQETLRYGGNVAVEPAVALVSVVKWADATTVEHPDTDVCVLCIETAPMELTMDE